MDLSRWLQNLPELLAAACCRRNGVLDLFNLRTDEFQDEIFPQAVPKERILLKTFKIHLHVCYMYNQKASAK